MASPPPPPIITILKFSLSIYIYLEIDRNIIIIEILIIFNLIINCIFYTLNIVNAKNFLRKEQIIFVFILKPIIILLNLK